MSKFQDNMNCIFNLEEDSSKGNIAVEGEIIQSTITKTNHIDDDYNYARQNLRDTINHAKLALDELQNIASVTESPRAFEVYAQLTKTIVDANKDLLELQHKLKRIKEDEPKQQVTNNSLFVGSTSDLAKLIKDQSNN